MPGCCATSCVRSSARPLGSGGGYGRQGAPSCDWAERTPAQREADLRTASSWAKLRQRRAPHADVDVGRLPALVETLVATLRETPSRRSRQKLRDPALERALAAEGAAPVALAAAGFLGLAGCVPPRPGGKRARSPTGESAPDAASHPPAMRAHLGAMPAVLMALEASHARRAARLDSPVQRQRRLARRLAARASVVASLSAHRARQL